MKHYLLPQGGKFYKVNMHSHSCFSDGRQTPEELKEAYSAHGYSAIAYTEHEGLYDFSHLTDDKFVAITSYEYGLGNGEKPPFSFYTGKPRIGAHVEQVHLNIYSKEQHNIGMVCYNQKYLMSKMKEHIENFKYVGEPDYARKFSVECFNEIIRCANENEMFVVYNHPNWSLNSYNVYGSLEGLTAIELINGASNRSSDMDYAPFVYDQMLRSGQRLGVVAGDDNHDTFHFFKAWTMVKADELTHESLTDAIVKGNCYSSDGPEIYDIYYENGRVYVTCSDAVGIFYNTAGRTKGCRLSENGAPLVNEASFAVSPDDIYFRISVRDAAGRHANTRAYFIDELKTEE